MPCREETRTGSFLKQGISLAIQVANGACVLGSVRDKTTVEKRDNGTKAKLYASK